MPVITFTADRSGPTVVVAANVHGDEVTGLATAHALDPLLTRFLRRGRVVVYPTLNPAGLAAVTRAVPADGADLNRAFPGKARGRPSERLADAIWTDLVGQEPDLVIDLHADSALAIPYAIVDRPVTSSGADRRALERRLTQLVRATGLTVIREYPDDLYVRFQLDRSLAGAAVNRLKIPAITIEAGPRRVVEEAAVRATLGAVHGVLHALDMVDEPAERHATRVSGGPWRRASGPRTRYPGLFRPAVAPGGRFVDGAVLGRLHAADGGLIEELCAPQSGLVLSWVASTWVTAGTVVGTLAVVERA